MRAYHMPSLPEIPLEHLHSSDGITDVVQMKLKVLYAVDNQTNFLARSSHACKVKTARVPIPGQHDIMTLGAVPLKEVIYPVMQSSPELFSDPSWDYSVYIKDVSEEDEPFVGQGFVSSILSKGVLDDEVLVPGRVCSSFASLLNKGASEILEIRLRLSRVNKAPHSTPQKPQQQEQAQSIPQQQPKMPSQASQQRSHVYHQTQPLQQQSQLYQTQPAQAQYARRQSVGRSGTSSSNKRPHNDAMDTEDEDDDHKGFVEPKPLHKKPVRYVNNTPAPKAARTQSLPTFEIVPPIARLPPQSIARRIYMADKNNERNSAYPYSMDQNGSSPVDIAHDVSKRFAPDFIAKTPDFMKQKKATRSISVQQSQPSKPANPGKIEKQQPTANDQASGVNEDNSQPPICFHCKAEESKSWRWNNSEDDSKRGMMCYQCYQYMNTKGVMRPKKLFAKQAQIRKRKEKAHASSSPSSSGNDTVPTTTPNVAADKNSLTAQYYGTDSSDPLNDLDEMITSDLDFTLGPMTDIDPFPQPAQQFSDDKENVPPQAQRQKHTDSRPVSVRKASRQTSFEKMLAKSFSGAPPVVPHNGMSPSDWMTDLFNAEPTPRDQENNVTPKDFDNTPRDMTTCNTLPCNEESPEETKTTSTNNANATKLKATAMPSSPLLDDTRVETSPNSMANSDWQHSEATHLGSQGHELPPKAHFQHDPSLGAKMQK